MKPRRKKLPSRPALVLTDNVVNMLNAFCKVVEAAETSGHTWTIHEQTGALKTMREGSAAITTAPVDPWKKQLSGRTLRHAEGSAQE